VPPFRSSLPLNGEKASTPTDLFAEADSDDYYDSDYPADAASEESPQGDEGDYDDDYDDDDDDDDYSESRSAPRSSGHGASSTRVDREAGRNPQLLTGLGAQSSMAEAAAKERKSDEFHAAAEFNSNQDMLSRQS